VTLLLLSSLLANAGIVDQVAAVVNGDAITLSEIYDLGGTYIIEQCGVSPTCVYEKELEVIDTLIKWSLVKGEMKRLDMQITGTDIDQAIDSIVRDYQLESRQELRKEVEGSGTRWEAYRDQIGDQLRAQRFRQIVVAPRIAVSDDEILDFYQKTARREQRLEVGIDALGLTIPPDADLPEVMAQARGLVDSINAKELSWEDAVRDYDAAGLSEVVSGNSYTAGGLTPKVESVVFSEDTPLDQVQLPIQVDQVLFVVKVLKREQGTGGLLPLEQVEEELRNSIFEEKLKDAEEEWYQRTRRESAVEVKLKAP
jgi:parvulin-like peptidyl-prolyl isomerase